MYKTIDFLKGLTKKQARCRESNFIFHIQQKWWCLSTSHNLKFLTPCECAGMLHRAQSSHALCAITHRTSSSKTRIYRHFLIFPCVLRFVHLPPCFLESVYFIWQIKAFIRRMGTFFPFPAMPAMPAIHPALHTWWAKSHTLLLPSATHRCWDTHSIPWAISLETSFKSYQIALDYFFCIPSCSSHKYSWKLAVSF